MVQSDGRPAPGRGFFVTLLSTSLPSPLINLMVDFAYLDRAMARHRMTPLIGTRRRAVLETHNALQHTLLSSSAWEPLDPPAKATSDPAIHSCCRLAALIYSNAVLFALPTHSAWNVGLTSKLRCLLDKYTYGEWPAGTLDMLIWVLFVGGLASTRPREQSFFKQTLRKALHRKGDPSWSAVQAILTDFIWSCEACGSYAWDIWLSTITDGSVEPV